MRVLGADVARGEWVGVVLDDGLHPVVSAVSAVSAATFDVLLTRAAVGGPLDAVGVDIPIGLPDTGHRAADVLVRRLVGPRAASVFTTPVRAALQAPDHAEAVRINRAAAGEGVSRQAFGLAAKVLEVDAVVRSWPPGSPRVVEVHPELSFAVMAGAPLASGKKTWAGFRQRSALLHAAGIALDGDLDAGAVAAVDDVLDAAAAAWTARRVAAACAVCHPDPPERSSDGWPAAIWV